LAAQRSVQIERASASCGSASANVLPAYDSTKACSFPRLGDELIEHIIRDVGFDGLDAIAYQRGRGDTFFSEKHLTPSNYIF